MSLRKVGFFFELPPQQRANALQAIRERAARPEEAKIIGYLESGTVYGATPGVEEDVLSDPPQIIGPTHTLTDGVWAWPRTLSYYVGRYHIALPDEFVGHMRSNNWRCPHLVDADRLVLEGEIALG